MNDTNTRGIIYLIGFLAFASIFCFFIPFVLLPNAGTAVALPVITVPAEYYKEDWPSPDFELVNSLGGALLANIIVLGFAFWAWRASKGWTSEVPRSRFQSMMEVIIEGLWGFTKQQAGSKPKVKNILFPLVASIFFFLLAGNLGKLLPGVETVGVLHCAVYEPVPLNGFPVHEINTFGTSYYVLENDTPLNTGTTGTKDSYQQCKAGLQDSHYASYAIQELDPFEDQAVTHTVEEGDTLASIAEQYRAEAEEIASGDLPQLSQYSPYDYTGWAEVNIDAASILAHNQADDGSVALEFEESVSANANADALSEVPLEPGQTVLVRPELIGADATTLHNQVYTVAPFIRGVSTDLSFTIGLALLAFVMFQYFGISELGLGYFQKFINVHALGGVGKNPLGIIDFVVGLFEIVSEFAKIISLAFRLFGALFAGTVLYAVIMFLLGTTTPVIILMLEVIVGTAQALVFAVLTLIFSAQAMVSHVHDDHEHHDDHVEVPAV